jgi:hypothetical protein
VNRQVSDIAEDLAQFAIRLHQGDQAFVIQLDHLARFIHHDQVRAADLAEVHAKWIHPETVRPLGIAHRDMTGHALAETESSEQPQCRGQAHFAMAALLFERGEHGRRRYVFGSAGSLYRGSSFRHTYRIPLPKRRGSNMDGVP